MLKSILITLALLVSAPSFAGSCTRQASGLSDSVAQEMIVQCEQYKLDAGNEFISTPAGIILGIFVGVNVLISLLTGVSLRTLYTRFYKRILMKCKKDNGKVIPEYLHWGELRSRQAFLLQAITVIVIGALVIWVNCL